MSQASVHEQKNEEVAGRIVTVLSRRRKQPWSEAAIRKLIGNLPGRSSHTCQQHPRILVLGGRHRKSEIKAALGKLSPPDFVHKIVTVTGRRHPDIPFPILWED